MIRPRYIYVTDQGDVFSSADEPTREDLQFASVGMLTIIRLGDLHYRRAESKWDPIRIGELTRAIIPAGEFGAFHATERMIRT